MMAKNKICTKIPAGRWTFFWVGTMLLWHVIAAPLFVQAPNDEWRRGGFDAMVAEPGRATSILSNPAGIKTKEISRRKNEWSTEIISADFFLTGDTWNLLADPAQIYLKLAERLGFLGLLGNNEKTRKFLQELTGDTYKKIIKDAGLAEDLEDLDLDKLLQPKTMKKLAENLRDTEGLLNSLSNSFLRYIFANLGEVGFEHYSRVFSLSHVNEQKPLVWGFYFGFEQKAALRNGIETVGMPIKYKIEDITLNAKLPLGLQFYLLAPLRVAVAHDFAEALPGFTFGLGLKIIPYIGINQTGLGNFISQALPQLRDEFLVEMFSSLGGINLGLDFGVQYHFGALLSPLEFLHTGLKISDLLGFNVPFTAHGDSLRYALDFDWGIYAEHQINKFLQVFGGFEIIQLRGLFVGGQSPYSALFDPVDHLRFLAGLSLFDNILRVTLQYYNSSFTPGVTLNWGIFQLQAALNINAKSAGSLGLELGLRFTSPHDGFRKRQPYKTYAQIAK